MNPFEKANLARLMASQEDKGIGAVIELDRKERLKEATENSIRLIVKINFEIHKGDLNKIKESLRKDAPMITGLKLEKIINDEYTKQSNPKRLRSRYCEETQRNFWQTILRAEAERSEKLRSGTA